IDRVFFLLLVLMVGSFFFSIAINAIIVPALFLLFLIDPRNDYAVWKRVIGTKRNIFLLIIFLCLLISTIYSADKQAAFKGIFDALPLIILPVSLYRIRHLPEQKLEWLKRIYVVSCFVFSAMTLLRAAINAGLLDGSFREAVSPDLYIPYFVNRFTYHQLSGGLHAVFLSLYVNLAIFFILENSFRRFNFKVFISLVLLIYFLIYLLLLFSITLNFALYSFLAIYFFLKFTFNKWQEYILFYAILITGTFVTWYLYVLKGINPSENSTYLFDSAVTNRPLLYASVLVFVLGSSLILIKRILNRKYAYFVTAILLILVLVWFGFSGNMIRERMQGMKETNISARFVYGNAAIKTIKKHLFLGIGIGDKKNGAIIDIKELPRGSLNEHPFNAHNQFLDFWIMAGIIPVIFFIAFLYNEFAVAFKQKHLAYLGLVYCFGIFCFIDLAMMGQRGQIFFLFFICFFTNESTKRAIEN
ncbi:MAG TPA: O-antigen ligase family protein, partial [Chitinophagaceae bacterium]|nr:O-antigen ligase family protein [Chitinophagaceae bacterium]